MKSLESTQRILQLRDSEGYWVAITATVNTTFGSKVIVPGTGIILNDEMDDFSSQPGVPNAFGLIGAENNSIAPGKRPLSSMSPTIVLDSNDEPILTVVSRWSQDYHAGLVGVSRFTGLEKGFTDCDCYATFSPSMATR